MYKSVEKAWANIPNRYLSDILGVQISRSRTAVYSDADGSLSPEEYKRLSTTEFGTTNVRTMKSFAVKLYILLYFHINSSGVGECLSYKEIATELNCTERTVHNSLNSLSQVGYICYTKLNPRYFSFSLNGFDASAFAARKNGGHGFVTLSREAAEELCSLSSINDLRIAFSCLVKCNSNAFLSSSKTAASIISISDFKKALPGYIRPCDIAKSMNRIKTSIGRVEEGYKEYAVFLSEHLNSRTQYESCKKDARRFISNHAEQICVLFSDTRAHLKDTGLPGIKNIQSFWNLGFDDVESIFSKDPQHLTFALSNTEVDSLSALAAQYGTEDVIQSIDSYIRIYILSEAEVKIDSPVSLITSILTETRMLAA